MKPIQIAALFEETDQLKETTHVKRHMFFCLGNTMVVVATTRIMDILGTIPEGVTNVVSLDSWFKRGAFANQTTLVRPMSTFLDHFWQKRPQDERRGSCLVRRPCRKTARGGVRPTAPGAYPRRELVPCGSRGRCWSLDLFRRESSPWWIVLWIILEAAC